MGTQAAGHSYACSCCLGIPEQSLAGQRSWAEIPFGGDTSVKDLTDERRALLPWDPTTPVVILLTRRLRSADRSIDFELDGAGTIARVTDYKSGKPPGKKQPVLKGGAELQRCLYAYAVRSLVPVVKDVETRLLFPRAEEDGLYALEDPAAVLASLAGFVKCRTALREGGECAARGGCGG